MEKYRTINDISVIIFTAKDFLKYDDIIIAFFKSNIGPNIKKADTAGTPK